MISELNPHATNINELIRKLNEVIQVLNQLEANAAKPTPDNTLEGEPPLNETITWIKWYKERSINNSLSESKAMWEKRSSGKLTDKELRLMMRI